MFPRLLVYAGFLVCLCLGLVGCEEEDRQIVKEVAELVRDGAHKWGEGCGASTGRALLR